MSKDRRTPWIYDRQISAPPSSDAIESCSNCINSSMKYWTTCALFLSFSSIFWGVEREWLCRCIWLIRIRKDETPAPAPRKSNKKMLVEVRRLWLHFSFLHHNLILFAAYHPHSRWRTHTVVTLWWSVVPIWTRRTGGRRNDLSPVRLVPLVGSTRQDANW